ncbi:choice-of-anchor D domain-containing protein, partial [bacterium]|nr:choice-of-anchor D domain-containing protein [bacterium]
MPKKFLIAPLMALAFSASLFPQGENVALLGRWAKGQSKALFRRGGFTFVGNGTYLEVYQKRVSVYEKLDEIILSGPVQDIFVQESNWHHVYVACGESGMDVVYFDYTTPFADAMLDTVIGRYDSDGFASGIFHSGSHVYLADGSGGMKIIYVGIPSQPQYKSTFPTAGFAHDVWVAGNTAYVAADQSGLYSISIADPQNPVIQDTLQFAKVFPEKPKPAARHIIAVGNKAYVAAGWGGMSILDISVPSAVQELGRWTQGGIPRHVTGVWVNANFAYVTCGTDGLVSHIDITNPAAPSIPLYSPLNTEGTAFSVIVSNDTAYVADGANGHLVVDVGIAAPPSILRRFSASGITRDVDLSGNYAYTATGESGLKIFNTAVASLSEDPLEEIGSCDTPGEAFSVRKSGNYAYVADGSKGLAVLNVSNPFSVVLETQVEMSGDSCRDADVSGNYAYLACGSDGLRIFNNIQSSPFEVAASPETRLGFARSVRAASGRVFIAHSRGVTVFSTAGLPQVLTPLDSLTSQMDARSLAVSGDTVFVANGDSGFAVWNLASGQVRRVNTDGFCSDVAVRNKSVYIADGKEGFAIYNISSLDNIVRVAYYGTGGDTRSLAVSTTGQRVVLADVQNGLHVLSNDIQPQLTVDPDHLHFGPVPLGYSRPLKFRVGNPGTAELRVTQIKLAGNSNAFRFSATSFTVPPGKSIPLTVWFEPRLPYPSEPIDHVVSAAIYSNADTLGMTLQGEATTLTVEGPYASDVFTIGLWHLDEGDGVVVAADASPRGLNGDVSGNPARISSREGYTRAVRFDGSNDWIRVPYNSIFNLTTSPFTVETWLNIAKKPATGAVLIGRGNGNTSQFELGLSAQENGGIVGKVWDSQGFEHRVHSGTLQALNENQWYHAAMTWDTDTLRLLINGFEEDQAAFSGSLRSQTSEPVSFGSNSLLTAPFNGILDEVRISGIARQPWEFHVNQSRITVSSLALDFGTVLMGKKRSLLLTVGNGGTQSLIVASISGSHESLSTLPKAPFALAPGRDTTVSVTFQPLVEVDLDEDGTIILSSSDPTYPNRVIRLAGKGVRNIPAGSYRTDPFTAGLWHFDQPGSVVVDSSGLGLNGRLYNGAVISNEIRKFDSGYAAGFDGNNDVCVIPLSENPLGPDWGGLTVEGWIYPRELPDGKGVLLRRGSSMSFQFNVYLDSTGTLYGQVQNSQGAIYTVSSKSKDPLVAQKWVHVALTADPDSIALFVNGQKFGSRSFAGGIKSGTTDVDTLALYLGNAIEGSRGFSGYMDEVRISTIKRQAWEFNVNDVRMELSSAQLNFGEVLEGSSRTLKILFRNIGSDILEVKSLQSSDPELFRIDTTWFRLYPDSSLFVSVTYSPAAEGYHLGQMTIQSNDPFWPVRAIILQGQAMEISSVGQYVADVYTVNLIHFDPETDVFDFGDREVFWSDSGRFGEALRFGGGWINFPVEKTIDLFSTPLTLECWFSLDRKPDSTATL